MKDKKNPQAIMWFRNDLRLCDNPALVQAAEFPIIPLFIWDKGDPYKPGGASQCGLIRA